MQIKLFFNSNILLLNYFSVSYSDLFYFILFLRSIHHVFTIVVKLQKIRRKDGKMENGLEGQS